MFLFQCDIHTLVGTKLDTLFSIFNLLPSVLALIFFVHRGLEDQVSGINTPLQHLLHCLALLSVISNTPSSFSWWRWRLCAYSSWQGRISLSIFYWLFENCTTYIFLHRTMVHNFKQPTVENDVVNAFTLILSLGVFLILVVLYSVMC